MTVSDPKKSPAMGLPFWRKPLEALNESEWESLCDGCGRCCLVKLEDEDTGEVHYTEVGCTLLAFATCRCSDYPNRKEHVPDCVKLTPEVVRSVGWLPPTCGYRLVAEGRDLPWWHPLVSGRPETVVEAGVSVRGKVAASEDDVLIEQLPAYIVTWPKRVPKRARGRAIAPLAPQRMVEDPQHDEAAAVGSAGRQPTGNVEEGIARHRRRL